MFGFWRMQGAGFGRKLRDMLPCKALGLEEGRAAGWDVEMPSLESDTYSEPLSEPLGRIKQRQKRALLGSFLSQAVPWHTYFRALAFVCLSLAFGSFPTSF